MSKHFVINPNISQSGYSAMTQEQKIGFIDSLKRCVGELKSNISLYVQDTKKATEVSTFAANIEIGHLKKFIHIDGIISLNTYNKLDFEKIRSMLSDNLSAYSSGVHLDIKYVHDNRSIVEAYSKKDGMSII